MSIPLDSQLPDEILTLLAPQQLQISLDKTDFISSVQAFQKAANYLALAQIYLASNALLRKPLNLKHIKKRILGHWGSCPGIIFSYAHVTAAIQANLEKHRFLYVTGPGHGAPATLAGLYLEGTMSRFFHDEGLNEDGIENFVRKFSWPGRERPSHVNAATPGAIHEGGGECFFFTHKVLNIQECILVLMKACFYFALIEYRTWLCFGCWIWICNG